MKVVLASSSPRRKELLDQIGIAYDIKVSNVDETVTSKVPYEVVQELSARKAQAVWDELTEEERETYGCVIGADTVVACDGEILGKPRDAEDAKRMLKMLQGREHEVFTGVTLVVPVLKTPLKRTFFEATVVKFYPMTDLEIETYVITGDPLDKAGAYGIQGFCARYIQGIEGDYNNVVGLPVGRLYQEMRGLHVL